MKKTARLIKYLASKDERMAYRAKEAANAPKKVARIAKEKVAKPPKVKKEKVAGDKKVKPKREKTAKKKD